jgi:hypothetical protein
LASAKTEDGGVMEGFDEKNRLQEAVLLCSLADGPVSRLENLPTYNA